MTAGELELAVAEMLRVQREQLIREAMYLNDALMKATKAYQKALPQSSKQTSEEYGNLFEARQNLDNFTTKYPGIVKGWTDSDWLFFKDWYENNGDKKVITKAVEVGNGK